VSCGVCSVGCEECVSVTRVNVSHFFRSSLAKCAGSNIRDSESDIITDPGAAVAPPGVRPG